MADPTSFIGGILCKLPVLNKVKNPAIAGALGFLIGAIGVGLYTWSLLDFVVCFLVAVIASIIVGATGGWLIAACFAGVYGVLRVLDSNKRRLDPAVIVDRQQPEDK